ncbi:MULTISPECIES: LamG-like jellyroll fold domain-containing protein [unclassified Rathayibacter]|uniref:LamG-like jellyroll fold domain-containing protein n=1 Tax=unclassified Rathayibacter TaxID=2609250 RepID=UPI00188B584C|nr:MULTISPECIES: LamG-like jellyroll fold domain-containing protein [unclassified Rathayibacter]MBF4461304.1 Ig-like domain-containing protein [Rathayibacter sp. VKM Ac-2879]MBF4502715.1 Ig-like domain-containing protein [Rathayibacter sp. VKM Ac-2878]
MTSPRRRATHALALSLSAATVVALTALVPVASPAFAADSDIPQDALVLRYDFEQGQVSGSKVTDLSSKKLDGTIVNSGSATYVAGRTAGTQAIDLPGGASDSTSAPYITVPNGVFQGISGATVSAWTKWSGTDGFQWLWCLGISPDAASAFAPSFDSGNARAIIKQLRGGGETGASSTSALPKDQWVNVTATMDGSTIALYLNGLQVASAPASVDLAAQLYSASASTSGNIGRALWNVHPYYDGAIDDFRVYNRALTAAQVRGLAGSSAPTVTALSTSSVTVLTNVGTAPTLPAGIDASYSDGISRTAPVTWDSVPASAYATRGSFTVNGVVTGTTRAVTAVVTVRTPGELSIDLGTTTGDFMGGASGSLYGVYGDGVPSRNLLEGMGLRTVSTKAQDGPQHPGADALDVVKPIADASNGDVFIYMTDIYRGFPYEWPGDTPQAKLADYQSKIAKQVDQVLSMPAQYQDNIVFVPFNEPEGNMFGNGQWSYNGTSWLDNPTDFFAAWDSTYALIKGKMPTARIAGPNTSILYNQIRGFMTHTLAKNTVPDVMTWHELSNPGDIRTNVDRFRSWEDELYTGTSYAGKHLPINLNEYAFNYHTSVPGQMIQWVSALEDKKVDGDIAYWNIDGNLSDSAVQANRANGQWWLLNAYSSMTGKTVAVTPPQPGASYTLQGVATLDTATKQARAIFGGSSGSQRVTFDRIPSATFGSKVHVKVNEIRWTGQVGDSGAPQTVKEYDATVTNGSLALDFGGSLPALDADSAYEVIVTPGANATSPSSSPVDFRQKYEAEDAPFTGTRNLNGPEGSPSNVGGFYTSGGRDVGGIRAGGDLKLNFQVTVPKNGDYNLSIFANSLNTFAANAQQGPVNAFVTVDGAAEQEVYLPLAYKFVVWDHADTKVALTAGTHTISLAAKNLAGTKSTVGDEIIDKIELSLPSASSATSIYEAETGDLSSGATADYSRAGVSGSGVASLGTGATDTLWTYSAKDAPASIGIDTLGGGSGDLYVNDVKVGPVTSSTVKQVFLSGGVNKIEVTGTSGTLLLDRITIGASSGALTSTSYEAEAATIAGPAVVRDLSLASGGKAVGNIGGGRNGDSSLTFSSVQAKDDGTYALTVRYSNEEQSPATHYNPDPIARHADITVNGVTQRVLFPHTFHQNQLWDLTVPVTLKKGSNTISFTSKELPEFDGKTYLSDTFPGVLLTSQYAPNIDKISVTPMTLRTAALTVDASALSRCIAGKVTVTGTATNTGPVAADVTVTSAWGSKSFAAVAPGKTVTAAFSTRATSVTAGTLTVASTSSTAGAAAPASAQPGFAALSCR